MKNLALAVLSLALLGAPGASANASACSFSCPSISADCDPPARWSDRYDAHDARIAITTENGETTLLATDEVIALQISDRTFHKVKHKLRDAQREDDDGALGHIIKVAVLESVQSLLDHSVEIRIRDISDVRYKDGRLLITDRNGHELFQHTEIDDREVMKSFSERDARAFVSEFKRLKARVG